MHSQVSWPGGLTHHQDAFAPLSRMLLALYTATALLDTKEGNGWLKELQEGMQRCTQLLTKQTLQPLLGNTLLQVWCHWWLLKTSRQGQILVAIYITAMHMLQ